MSDKGSNRRSSSIVANQVTSVFEQQHQLGVIDENAALDDKTLGALGYKQEFKRDFTFLESFSVSFSVLGLLPSVASTIGYSLGYSGTGGAIWGWLIAAIMIQATAFTMGEYACHKDPRRPVSGRTHVFDANTSQPNSAVVCRQQVDSTMQQQSSLPKVGALCAHGSSDGQTSSALLLVPAPSIMRSPLC